MIRALETYLNRKHAARLGRNAIAWLCKHENDFAISRAAASAIPWQVKPVAELMFLLTTLKRHGVWNSSLDRLSAAAIATANDFDWHELAAYDPSAATGMALAADFYRSLDRPVPFDREYFGFLNSIGYFQGTDRMPYRDMDLAYNLARMVSPEYDKDLAMWFQSTAFGREQHIVRYTIDDLYSLTHAIFYLTDLGLRDVDELLDEATCDRLRRELSTLTAAMLRADNTDVLGELALCWIFCRVPDNRLNRIIFDEAIHRVMASATKDGAIAPTASIFGQAREAQATFHQLYHTTLVGAFFFTMLSETGRYGNN
jgi:hypothetical protein